ncbi:hypothetical protein ABZ412_34280 [Nocardia sp. NPDC005746]|uniref:hypothetical protein n=1 Tax=Nocardia sp. NPDC005746 TaxID=3157062 RepID=UPI0034099D42
MSPTVGRVVHYQSYGTPGGEHVPAPQAAIVTKAEGYLVSLAVFYDNGISFKSEVPHAENDEPAAGCWNWPPRG